MRIRTLFLFIFSLAAHTYLHAAQMNVEVKEQEEKPLSAEEKAASQKIFRSIHSFYNSVEEIKILQKLLQRYPAIVNQRESICGNTALISAARLGHSKAAELLIAAGADLNLQDKHGYTALMMAAWNDHAAIVQALIAAGADETLQNNFIKTARYIAMERGNRNAYIAAVARGKQERKRYLHAQKEAGTMFGEYMIAPLAKITAEYAYNPQVLADLPKAPETKQSWWDKAKGLASKLF